MKKILIFVFISTISFQIFSYSNSEETNEEITKPITIVVPYGPGGSTDSTCRALVKEVERIYGNTYNIENISGISGTVGASVVSESLADGYTLLFSPSDPFTTQPNRMNLPYNLDSFVVVAGFSFETNAIVVRSDSPWQTLDDLINEKGVIDRGHSGIGGISHTCLELFFNQAGLKYRDVPFESGKLAIDALSNGHVDVVAGTPGPMVPYLESGEFRALALTSEHELEYFPGIPTLKESGFDIVITVDWFLLAPKGTPVKIVELLSQSFMDAANSEGFKDFVIHRGQTLNIRDGATMKAKIEKDYEMFKEYYNRITP